MKIPNAVDNLIKTLKENSDNPEFPEGCYFSKLQDYFDIAEKSAGARFNNRSNAIFDLESFKENTICPFLSSLVKEIKEAFCIPQQLKGFTSVDPTMIPREAEDLASFGAEGIKSLADFYGQPVSMNGVIIPPLLNKDSLQIQYTAFKNFAFKIPYEFFYNK